MKIRLWLLLGLSVSLIAWLYVTRVLNPWQEYVRSHNEHDDRLKAQMWDIYPRWVGARELLLRGRNPYGPEVSREIQTAYYGHAITQDYQPGHKIVDEWRFAYPVYVVFLMAPLIHVDFSEVQRWAPPVLGLFAAVCVPLCLDILHWRLTRTAAASITLLTVSSPQIVQGMRHQQLAVVVGLLLITGAWCVCRNHLASAGAILAWSTIKPQMALFPLCFFLVWVMGNWRERWRLLAGFVAALGMLIGAGDLILPGWIGYFVEGMNAYRKYFPTTSLLRMALGDTAGEIVGGIILLGLLAFAWRNRREPAGSRRFSTVFAAFLIGTALCFPLLTPFNQVLLILPIMMVLQDWKTLPTFSRAIFIVSVGWPWLIYTGLLLFPPRLDSPNQPALLPSLLVAFFPLLLPFWLATRRGTIVAPQGPAPELPPS